MHTLLETYPNTKIILTNANDDEMEKFGLLGLPYDMFTMKHEPNKTDPSFYKTMLEHFNLRVQDVVYFEHNIDAVKSAKSIGITTYHYDKETKDIAGLKNFLDTHAKSAKEIQKAKNKKTERISYM